jgi:hypothetical protein
MALMAFRVLARQRLLTAEGGKIPFDLEIASNIYNQNSS